MNMGELPAMSMNVQKLVSLTNDQTATNGDLAEVILQDYSLTNKVLQVINSAYYALQQSTTSILQAVNILGFDTIRDLAIAIALFEDFIKSGVEKESISKLLARSFLSGTLARQLAGANKIGITPEEAFICTIFHNLGKVILAIYLPEKYRHIEQMVDGGKPQNDACREVLADLTYQEIGIEVAKFWNLPEKIVAAMAKNPKAPTSHDDGRGLLQNMANFANMLVDCVGNGSDLDPVFNKYGERLSLSLDESIDLLKKCLDLSENVSDTIHYGFTKLDIRERLQNLEINTGHGRLNSYNPYKLLSRKVAFRSCGDEEEVQPETVAEPPPLTNPSPGPNPTLKQESPVEPHPSGPKQEPVAAGAKKCLVVDDDQTILAVVNECLGNNGYHCVTAKSGEAALPILVREEFDIMITDIQMNGMTGIELTQKAKTLYEEMPVIVMTGFTDIYTCDQAIEAGASDFLEKPFSLKELVNRVAKVIHDARLLALLKQSSKDQAEIGNLMIAGLQEEAAEKLSALEAEIQRLKRGAPGSS
jgi:HD-like signal output (HDOD) protein/DNA-binding response OmpR family regulator